MVTIDGIKKRIAGGESVRSVVEEAFKKLVAAKDYNVAISETRDRALKRADQLDAKLKKGESAGKLAGVPFIAKDNYLAFGAPTTAASNILKNFEAPYQATVIEKLEAEGAILIAKANLDAFAHGSSTENSDFGPTKNPHDRTRVPGGSSGGSVVAVTLGIVPFALGSDTGGSIRLPASFCGAIGVKPTYGLVSRYGVIAMASSTDVMGPITNNADDAALVLGVIAGADPKDSTTLSGQKSLLPSDNTVSKLKIGIVKEYMTDAVQKEVRESVEAKADELRKLGHSVEEVSLPTVDMSLAVYYIVAPAEISSNLLRYDGVKYGYSAKDAKNLDELYGLSRDEGFGAEAKRRILTGTYVLSSGYIDAYYRKAQTVRTKIINDFAKAFGEYDVLIGPVAPYTAFKLGENTSDPLQMYLADVMAVAVSLAGLPALSVPAGKDKLGLPIGLQLIGAQQSDGLLLALAKQLEGAK